MMIGADADVVVIEDDEEMSVGLAVDAKCSGDLSLVLSSFSV